MILSIVDRIEHRRLRSLRHAKAFVDSVHAAPPWYASLTASMVRPRFTAPKIRGFAERVA